MSGIYRIHSVCRFRLCLYIFSFLQLQLQAHNATPSYENTTAGISGSCDGISGSNISVQGCGSQPTQPNSATTGLTKGDIATIVISVVATCIVVPSCYLACKEISKQRIRRQAEQEDQNAQTNLRHHFWSLQDEVELQGIIRTTTLVGPSSR